MADSPLDKALKRRDELAKEIAEIDHFVAYYHRFSEPKAERIDTSVESESRPAKPSPALKRKRKKASPAQIAKASAESIRAARRPLSRSELVVALEGRGLVMESKDKPRYVGTILWRLSEQFVNLEGKGYWLRDQPYAGHDPAAVGELSKKLEADGTFDDLLGTVEKPRGVFR